MQQILIPSIRSYRLDQVLKTRKELCLYLNPFNQVISFGQPHSVGYVNSGKIDLNPFNQVISFGPIGEYWKTLLAIPEILIPSIRSYRLDALCANVNATPTIQS